MLQVSWLLIILLFPVLLVLLASTAASSSPLNCPKTKEIVKFFAIYHREQTDPGNFVTAICPTRSFFSQTGRQRVILAFSADDFNQAYTIYFNSTGYQEFRGESLQLVLWPLGSNNKAIVSLKFERPDLLSVPVSILLANMPLNSGDVLLAGPAPAFNLTINRVNNVKKARDLDSQWPGYENTAFVAVYFSRSLPFARLSRAPYDGVHFVESTDKCRRDIVSVGTPLLRRFGYPTPAPMSFNTDGPSRDYCSPDARTIVIEIGGGRLPAAVQINIDNRVVPGRGGQFVLALTFDNIGQRDACPASVIVNVANWATDSLKLLYGCPDSRALQVLTSNGSAANVTVEVRPRLRQSQVPGPYLRAIRFQPAESDSVVLALVTFDPFTYDPEEAMSQVKFVPVSRGLALVTLDSQVLANCSHTLAWAAVAREPGTVIANNSADNGDSCRLTRLPDGSASRLIVSGECGSAYKANKVSGCLLAEFHNWRPDTKLTGLLSPGRQDLATEPVQRRYVNCLTWSDKAVTLADRIGPRSSRPTADWERKRAQLASHLTYQLSLTHINSSGIGGQLHSNYYALELRPNRSDLLYGAIVEQCRLLDADTGQSVAELVTNGCTQPGVDWLGQPGFYRNLLRIRQSDLPLAAADRPLFANCRFNPCYLRDSPALAGLSPTDANRFGIGDCLQLPEPCGAAHAVPVFESASQPVRRHSPASTPAATLLPLSSTPSPPTLLPTPTNVVRPPLQPPRCPSTALDNSAGQSRQAPPSEPPHYPLWSHALAALISYALGLATLAAVWFIFVRQRHNRHRRRQRRQTNGPSGPDSFVRQMTNATTDCNGVQQRGHNSHVCLPMTATYSNGCCGRREEKQQLAAYEDQQHPLLVPGSAAKSTAAGDCVPPAGLQAAASQSSSESVSCKNYRKSLSDGNNSDPCKCIECGGSAISAASDPPTKPAFAPDSEDAAAAAGAASPPAEERSAA